MGKRKNPSNQDVYERITGRVLEAIESAETEGIPWRSGITGAALLMPPHNAFRGNAYHGVNLATLSLIGTINGYRTQGYATFNQVKQKGGSVKKGERGVPLVAYFPVDKDEEGNTIRQRKNESDAEYAERVADRIMIARTTRPVFNLDQTEGLEKYIERYMERAGPGPREGEIDSDLDAMQESLLDLAESRLSEMGIRLHFMDTPTQPRYRPISHEIVMPDRDQFEHRRFYAETLLHEGTHATMWDTGRVTSPEDVRAFVQDPQDYAREELVAELGSLFIATRSGIEKDFANQASYISDHGLTLALKDNPRLLFEASRKAGDAAEQVMTAAYLEAVDEIRLDHGFSPLGETEFSDEAMDALDQRQREARDELEGFREKTDADDDDMLAENAGHKSANAPGM